MLIVLGFPGAEPGAGPLTKSQLEVTPHFEIEIAEALAAEWGRGSRVLGIFAMPQLADAAVVRPIGTVVRHLVGIDGLLTAAFASQHVTSRSQAAP